ncbi:hypothetical protein [Aurantimonas sp. 22II-16-19i]|uniref:hypothetical protein n=1 Tax=Aurantimonas sp. 22II-16-19i TaxID=1317114 RepID=UPI0009F7D36E|nr:hypothetical protein [Aurantimonas sp. 22II-16-19i]ORE97578.1 hypothetical protein ATO4_08165 [Aurantimonas sp. 22II-16-19i]
MLDPQSIPAHPGLPEWVLWIGGGLGVAVSTVVLKLGLKSGGRTGETVEPARLDVALVDGVSVRRLAGAVDGLSATMRDLDGRVGERVLQSGESAAEKAEALGDLLRDLTREVQELRLELRQIRGELSRG